MRYFQSLIKSILIMYITFWKLFTFGTSNFNILISEQRSKLSQLGKLLLLEVPIVQLIFQVRVDDRERFQSSFRSAIHAECHGSVPGRSAVSIG